MDERAAAPRGREFDLDPFRGLVCLCLVGLHFCWLSEAHEPLMRLAGPTAAAVAAHARLGVESFLVLAGFMMAHMLRPTPGERVRPGAYFARRCRRLLLPFWAAVLLAAADHWAAHMLFGGGRGRPGAWDLLAQLALVNEFFGVREPAVGYWSLAALEQFYAAWLICLALARPAGAGTPDADARAAARMGVVALAVFVASGSAYLFLGPEAADVAQYAFFIALGILLYGRTRLGVYGWQSGVALALMIGAAAWLQHSRLAAALVAAGVLYALARGRRFPGGPVFGVLRFVGRRSYSVYLVHAVVGMRLLTGYRYVARYDDWVVIPLLAAAVAGSLAAAEVFYRWVERPCQDLARRTRYRTPVAEEAALQPGLPVEIER